MVGCKEICHIDCLTYDLEGTHGCRTCLYVDTYVFDVLLGAEVPVWTVMDPENL